jgi:hypothetical protein
MAAAAFTVAASMAEAGAAVGAVAAGAEAGAAVGVGAVAAGIAAGVGDWRLARSSARPLPTLIMATDMDIQMAMDIHTTGQATVTVVDPAAGSGGGCGRRAATISAGVL